MYADQDTVVISRLDLLQLKKYEFKKQQAAKFIPKVIHN